MQNIEEFKNSLDSWMWGIKFSKTRFEYINLVPASNEYYMHDQMISCDI